MKKKDLSETQKRILKTCKIPAPVNGRAKITWAVNMNHQLGTKVHPNNLYRWACDLRATRKAKKAPKKVVRIQFTQCEEEFIIAMPPWNWADKMTTMRNQLFFKKEFGSLIDAKRLWLKNRRMHKAKGTSRKTSRKKTSGTINVTGDGRIIWTGTREPAIQHGVFINGHLEFKSDSPIQVEVFKKIR